MISNPAHFDKNGCLQIQRYEDQNWCSLSARNLCKGEALREYIANRAADNVNFSRVSYAGDGANDLCPSLKLSNNDNVSHGLVIHYISLLAISAKQKN